MATFREFETGTHKKSTFPSIYDVGEFIIIVIIIRERKEKKNYIKMEKHG